MKTIGKELKTERQWNNCLPCSKNKRKRTVSIRKATRKKSSGSKKKKREKESCEMKETDKIHSGRQQMAETILW